MKYTFDDLLNMSAESAYDTLAYEHDEIDFSTFPNQWICESGKDKAVFKRIVGISEALWFSDEFVNGFITSLTPSIEEIEKAGTVSYRLFKNDMNINIFVKRNKWTYDAETKSMVAPK